ncbi:beta-glucosidase [Yamadazyma tenuis]|uniref:beta-glucosidase n=1 Tax=Candida tenuis TaxID=2315449 RepID=UPI0027A74BED|nr:beta-glucosidase [Yamadazyma tenuis]
MDVEKILTQLTLEEKILLLSGKDNWHTHDISRLKIPKVKCSDGPNGVRGSKGFNGVPAACFPCGTALASTFNKSLLTEAGKLMGLEAKHKSAHIILGPTCNMQRGPLGGRGFESFSEDPYLSGMSSSAVINGIQHEHIAATIKHYVCNDLEHERKASDSILSERNLREIYLEPFRLAVKYSSPRCFMTSYTKVNGDRASQSKKLLNDILRGEWGWNGLIMSDWHGLYTSETALKNGLDLEMPGPTYYRSVNAIKHMVESRELNIQFLDERVRNVLNLVNFTLDSGIIADGPEDTDNDTQETSALLRKLSAESIVLLKNEDKILPLAKYEKIAVIGPNAKTGIFSGGGSAFLRPYHVTTSYDGISSKLSNPPEYTVGCYSFKQLPSLANQLTNPFTGKVGYNMKFFLNPPGKANRRQFDELNLDQAYIFLQDYRHSGLNSDLYYIDIEGDFAPQESAEYSFGCTVLGTALLYVDDKLVVDNKHDQKKGNSFFNSGSTEKRNSIFLKKGKSYRVKVEFGSRPTFSAPDATVVDFGGGGGIAFGCAKVIDPQEEIKHAASISKQVDKVVLCIGLSNEWETEGSDRDNMDLPLLTNQLVEAVLKANPNTVIVNQSVQSWYGGNEAGHAIADVLFGDYNPSGRLSLTFPLTLVDNPTFLNFKTERGRVLYGEDIFMGYRYYEKMKKAVSFPFGHGLSYTSFEYSKLLVEIDEENDELNVCVSVENTGSCDGDEVIQLYTSHKNPKTIKPCQELKGYEKVSIKAGESARVEIHLSLKDSLSFFDEYFGKWSLEAGEYEFRVGKSSGDIRLTQLANITKGKLWLGL